MKIAVVILNWNGKSLLQTFLPDVIQHSPEAEVIVADNASTDDSLQWLKNNFPLIRTIQLKKNFGFAGGYNEALKQVNAEYYVLLNTDVRVTPGWISPVISFLEKNTEAAACQPKIKSYENPDYFEHAGAAGGFIDKYGYPFCRGRVFTTLEKDKGQYNDIKEIFWASGACLFIRSAVFNEMNGFDEEFFAHMEEIDLCWRMQNKGYKIYNIPQSEVFHLGGGSLPKKNSWKTYLNFRNNLMMIHKNLPGSSWLRIFILRLFLDGIAGLKFLLEGGFADCAAVFNAHIYFYMNYTNRNQLRKKVQGEIKVHNKKNIYRYSIVWQYFIKRKKYFSNIKPVNE